MEVILLERIEKLGQMGDLVNVKDGFARNFLLPQQKALRATAANRERFESDRSQLEADNLERRGEAEAVSTKMDGLTVVMVRQAGDTGQLYGSVNARPIKIILHPEVSITVTANVARSEEEAKLQAQGVDMTATDRDEEESIGPEAAAELFEEEAQPVLTDEAGEGQETAPDSGDAEAADGEKP
jgi:large subunit ribosomal protein L9